MRIYDCHKKPLWVSWPGEDGRTIFYPLDLCIRRETVLLHIGYWDWAREQAERNLEFALKTGQKMDIARCYYNLAGFKGRFRDLDGSLELYRQAMDMFDEGGQVLRKYLALWNIGNVHKEKDEYGPAIDCYLKALPVLKAHGLYHEVATIMTDLGEIYWKMGREETAREYLLSAIELSQKHECLRSLVEALNECGQISFEKNEWDTAASFYKQALEVCRRIGDKRTAAMILRFLGEIDLLRRRMGDALSELNLALNIALEINHKQIVDECKMLSIKASENKLMKLK